MTIITIGSNSGNKIVLNNPHVSGHHAEIKMETNGSLSLTDTSMNGTWVNGHRIHKGTISVSRGDSVMFANAVKLDWDLIPRLQTDDPKIKHRITVGKNADNTIQIHSPNISRYHATIKVDKRGRVFIHDQSTNGVFVNDYKVPRSTDFPVKRGDRVSFAHVQDLEWKKVPKVRRLKPALYLSPVVVILTVLGILKWEALKDIGSGFSGKTVAERYENSIGLVYNSYYLAYVDNGDTLCFIGAGKAIALRKDQLRPFEITGSGFYISDKGEIITNKHVAAPWESEGSMSKEAIEKEINKARFSIGQIPTEPEVVGVPVRIGIFPNGSKIDKGNLFKNMLPCRFVNAASEKEVDLAMIQLETEKLPAGCSPVKNIISSPKEEIKVGNDVSIYGYPFGLELAGKNSEHKIKATLTGGTISKISDRYEIQYSAPSYHGASGSPVFSKEGVLVAVNYAGIEKAQGYNFGVIATHIRKLLGD